MRYDKDIITHRDQSRPGRIRVAPRRQSAPCCDLPRINLHLRNTRKPSLIDAPRIAKTRFVSAVTQNPERSSLRSSPRRACATAATWSEFNVLNFLASSASRWSLSTNACLCEISCSMSEISRAELLSDFVSVLISSSRVCVCLPPKMPRVVDKERAKPTVVARTAIISSQA